MTQTDLPVDAGLQLHLPTYRDASIADIRELAQRAVASGFSQIWVTDNLTSHNTFVVLADLASHVEAPLGTAILAQYLRSPLQTATAVRTVSELMAGRRLDLGIGAGNPSTRRLLSMPSPGVFMRETAGFLRALLAGKEVATADFPLVSEYFRLVDGATIVGMPAATGPIAVFGGGNGPQGLALAGESLDGLIVGWTLLPAARLGRLASMLDLVEEAAHRSGRSDRPGVVGEVKISIARSRDAARDFVRAHHASAARRWLGLRDRGYSAAELAELGMPADRHAEMERSLRGEVNEPGAWMSDELIDAFMVAGDPAYCRYRAHELVSLARHHGITQLIFSELGPDPLAAVELLGEHVLPVLSGRAN